MTSSTVPSAQLDVQSKAQVPSPTSALAEFCSGLTYSELPEPVVAAAKRILLDSLGCGLAGSTTELGEAVLVAYGNLAAAQGSAHLLGHDETTAAEVAALLNAFYVNALDYDESSLFGHPASSVVSSALAVGEERHVDGQGLLVAIIAGYEVSERVAASIWPSVGREAEVWGIGTHQTLGAAAAAARASGMPSLETAEVLGLAGVIASLPSARQWNWGERPLSWHKDSVAWAAFGGVQACRLRTAGFRGPRRVLEGTRSLWRMSASDQLREAELTDGLGSEWRILSSGIKPYSCCRWLHTTLDAVIDATRGRPLTSNEVASVEVVGVGVIEDFGFTDPHPANLVDAEFSINYAVSMALLAVQPGPEWYDPRRLANPDIGALSERVRFSSDSEFTRIYDEDRSRMPAKVRIELRSGDWLEGSAEHPSGGPQRPLSEMQLEEKFMRLAVPSLGRTGAADLAHAVSCLDQLSNLDALFPRQLGRTTRRKS